MDMQQPDGIPQDNFVQRVQRLFHPGPLDWILGLTPPKERFRAGEHMHGLDGDDGDTSARSMKH
jgi:hypothetical protein